MSSPESAAGYDVVVIGGGVAGLTAGLFSARYGHSTLVLEAAVPGGHLVNFSLWHNPDYDKLIDQVRLETDIEKAAAMFIQMNDILIEDVAIMPLVNRSAGKYGITTTLRDENVDVSDFEVDYWNIANWTKG